MKRRIIAVIPARGDSKEIPKKNIISFVGRPLIAWSIRHARESKLVDEVYVSTDDKKIAEISHQYGARVIMRPPELATERSSSEDALLHALDFIENSLGKKVDIVVFLQATSPLREKSDIDRAIKKFISEKADSLFSCSKVRDCFIWERKGDGFASVTYNYRKRKPRQLIASKFLENGSFYIFKPCTLRKMHNRLGGKIAVFEMPSWKSFQIDNWEDLIICAYFMKEKILRRDDRHV